MQDSNGCVQNGTPSSSGDATPENGHREVANGGGHELFLDHTKRDIVRLIGQYLKNEGLTHSAEMLMSESGCRLDHPAAVKFKHHIMDGDWTKADLDLQELQSLIISSSDLVEMRFLILEQKYLEHLEDGKVLDALHVLRNELTPLQHNTSRVHQLSSYMMCTTPQELMERTNWEGKGAESRTTLMNKLQTYLPPTVMLPPHRLSALLTQALEYQTTQCVYHNTSQGIALQTASLLTDHCCPKEEFPTNTLQIKTDHCDEVWYCQFSPDGTMLATGSKDNNVIIWDVDPDTYRISVKKVLEGHNYGAAYISWCPDNLHILVCGSEESAEVWLWNTDTEKYLKICQSQDDALTCGAWHKSGTKFVVGGARGHFYQCDMEGNVLENWDGVRVNGLHCRKDGKTVLASDTHHRIRSYVLEELTDSDVLHEEHGIMSFTVDKNDRLCLLNVAMQGVHLWDLNYKCLVRKYRGVTQGQYTIHSTFGGVNQDYIASGSEDSMIYIWHIKNEDPIATLTGHTRTVNCVAWNPVYHGMLVSVSDDLTIRVWGPKSKMTNGSNGKPVSSTANSGDSTNGTWSNMLS